MTWITVRNALVLATLLPLAGFFVLAFWGRRIGREGAASGWLATGLAVFTFALSVIALVLWAATLSLNRTRLDYIEAFTYHWIDLPSSSPAATPVPGAAAPALPLTTAAASPALTVGILIDSLTVSAFVLVSLISLMVHLFSLGQAGGGGGGTPAANRRLPRFFSLLQLLSFAILAFLLSNSLVQSLVFWEFIGIAAFLLVGFDHDRPAGVRPAVPSRAALYMFVIQAMGDAAFILGLGILLLHTGSFAGMAFFDSQGTSILSDSVSQAPDIGVRTSEFLFFTGHGFLDLHWLTWVGICFLVAALTRMAQFPLQAWVHHAARAPLPVSAMLQGGVFLVASMVLLARVYPILTIDARFILAVVGCISLVAGALIALVQSDIRGILAWSTVSQGGYMLLFLGAGGYTAAILQLFTHAFFKTALLLAAGTVLHGLASSPGSDDANADLRQLGGLWKRFPITAAISLIAALALAGAPWLSGAYSTNLGLACVYDYAHALQGESPQFGKYELLLFWLPALTTYLTALGIGRWWWLIFAGTPRNPRLLEKARESAFLTFPAIILAGFSVGFWFDFFGILPLIAKSVPPTLAGLVIDKSNLEADAGYTAALRASAWSCLGFGVIAVFYLWGFAIPNRLRRIPGLNLLDYWLRERMFFDTLYQGLLLNAWAALRKIVQFVERLLVLLIKLLTLPLRLAIFLIARLESPSSPPTQPPVLPAPHTLVPNGPPSASASS